MHGGDHARVEALREEAETLRPRLTDRQAIAPLLVFLGLAALDRDDYEETAALLEEGLSMFREFGDLYGIAMGCGTLGFAVLHQGDVARAAARFEEALRSLRDLRDRVGVFHCLLGAASVTGLRGGPGRAARLWGAAETLGETAAVAVFPVLRSRYDYEEHVATARSQLGEEAFTAAWSEGRKMSPEQAIEYALEPPEEALEGPSGSPQYPAGMSGREVEVLALAAAGLTNARIAEELYISPRTVNAHLGSVYRKVGVGSRAAAARFASEHGLL
jgi:DNA-binding CsgD family transcriptional regulator